MFIFQMEAFVFAKGTIFHASAHHINKGSVVRRRKATFAKLILA